MWEMAKAPLVSEVRFGFTQSSLRPANPLDLFQFTVPARTTWDTQLTKASGWLTSHHSVSLPASLGSDSNSPAGICALTLSGRWVWCRAGPPSLRFNYGDGPLPFGDRREVSPVRANNEAKDYQRCGRRVGSTRSSALSQPVSVWNQWRLPSTFIICRP